MTQFRLLAPALIALAVGFGPTSPALANTYVVVLKSPFPGPLPEFEHVQFSNPDGMFGIPAAGFGGYVDKGRITVPRVSDEEVRAQFGPALDAMHEILKMGLPPLSHSYVVLFDSKTTPPGYLSVGIKSHSYAIEVPGQALLTDGYSYAPFTPGMGQIEADFGALLMTLEETRKAGLPVKPEPVPVKTYVALLENPDGTAGKIIVSDQGGTTVIEQPGQAMRLDPGHGGAFQADMAKIRADFGAALDARPPLPTQFTLFFEIGSARLTKDSQDGLAKLLADLRNRPLPEIRVQGHTDTVGGEAHNNKLARKRADFVAKRIQTTKVADHLEIEAYGKHRPLVVTPDHTPEPRNRRVEVYIR
jgi:peptidoglycan-associated lipoprotein